MAERGVGYAMETRLLHGTKPAHQAAPVAPPIRPAPLTRSPSRRARPERSRPHAEHTA